MNNRELYLAWLRKNAPQVYAQAVRKVTGKKRSLGGLGDDLLGSMMCPATGFGYLGQDDGTIDTVTIDSSPQPDYSVLPPIPVDLTSPVSDVTLQPIAPPSYDVTLPTIDTSGTSSGVGDFFTKLTTAVAGVATAALTTNAQTTLLKTNTQRAQMGLPPVDANGVPVRPSYSLYSSNPQVASFERRVAGTAMSPVVLIAGVGLIAAMLFMRRA
jgi:hypothetical protein